LNQGGDALSRQQLSFTGYKETTEEKIRKVTKMKEGSVYSPKDLHDDAKAIADNYGRGGYVDLIILPQGTSRWPRFDRLHTRSKRAIPHLWNGSNIIGTRGPQGQKVIRRSKHHQACCQNTVDHFVLGPRVPNDVDPFHK